MDRPHLLSAGIPEPDGLEDLTLPGVLRHQAELRGDAEFANVCGNVVSFKGIDNLSDQLALGMYRLGVRRFDRVAMLLPNCLELVVIWFAAAKIGGIEVPCNPALKGELLVHNLNNCGASVLFADRSCMGEIARIQDSLRAKTIVLVDATVEEARSLGIRIQQILDYEECFQKFGHLERVEGHYSDPMAILYTSGTTGAAKGVVMSHKQCFSWATAMAANLGYTRSDSYFSPLPLFHTDAQMFGIFMPLIFGTQTTVVERFSASKFWEQIKQCGATATNMLGAMGVILMRAPTSEQDSQNTIRVAQCIPMLDGKEAFEERFDLRLVTAYGQTETSFVTYDTVTESRSGSCGRPHPDWQVAVVDEFDRMQPPGAAGEIVCRPKKNWQMFSGYHNMEAQTVRTWRNLWYHSGDSGYLDGDGWLYFKHRLGESIRRRGENISADQIEAVANGHPDVVESAAFGIPSELTEEDVMVVVRRREGSALDATELLVHFRRDAPRHMVPRFIEITEASLPRTPTEKISRSELKRAGVQPTTFDNEQAPPSIRDARRISKRE